MFWRSGRLLEPVEQAPLQQMGLWLLTRYDDIRWALGGSRLSSTMPPPAADFANGSSDLLADMYTFVKSSLVFTVHPGGRCAAADTCRRESRPRSVPRARSLHFRPPKPTKRRVRTWNPLLPLSAAGPARRSHRLADRVRTLADPSPSRSIRLRRQLQRTDIAFSPRRHILNGMWSSVDLQARGSPKSF